MKIDITIPELIEAFGEKFNCIDIDPADLCVEGVSMARIAAGMPDELEAAPKKAKVTKKVVAEELTIEELIEKSNVAGCLKSALKAHGRSYPTKDMLEVFLDEFNDKLGSGNKTTVAAFNEMVSHPQFAKVAILWQEIHNAVGKRIR
jgi:hypothetical protein